MPASTSSSLSYVQHTTATFLQFHVHLGDGNRCFSDTLQYAKHPCPQHLTTLSGAVPSDNHMIRSRVMDYDDDVYLLFDISRTKAAFHYPHSRQAATIPLLVDYDDAEDILVYHSSRSAISWPSDSLYTQALQGSQLHLTASEVTGATSLYAFNFATTIPEPQHLSISSGAVPISNNMPSDFSRANEDEFSLIFDYSHIDTRFSHPRRDMAECRSSDLLYTRTSAVLQLQVWPISFSRLSSVGFQQLTQPHQRTSYSGAVPDNNRHHLRRTTKIVPEPLLQQLTIISGAVPGDTTARGKAMTIQEHRPLQAPMFNGGVPEETPRWRHSTLLQDCMVLTDSDMREMPFVTDYRVLLPKTALDTCCPHYSVTTGHSRSSQFQHVLLRYGDTLPLRDESFDKIQDLHSNVSPQLLRHPTAITWPRDLPLFRPIHESQSLSQVTKYPIISQRLPAKIFNLMDNTCSNPICHPPAPPRSTISTGAVPDDNNAYDIAYPVDYINLFSLPPSGLFAGPAHFGSRETAFIVTYP